MVITVPKFIRSALDRIHYDLKPDTGKKDGFESRSGLSTVITRKIWNRNTTLDSIYDCTEEPPLLGVKRLNSLNKLLVTLIALYL